MLFTREKLSHLDDLVRCETSYQGGMNILPGLHDNFSYRTCPIPPSLLAKALIRNLLYWEIYLSEKVYKNGAS